MNNNTTRGCADITKAVKPLSTNCKAQTTAPLPKEIKRKLMIRVLYNCRLPIASLIPDSNAIKNMSRPATINRIDANIKGGNSVTAILFNK
jgi:hypothetical protein